MKKLAFALMCLVSVAFFASCTKTIDNPEPSIAPITETGFVTNGQTVEIGEVFVYGFTMTSNTQTKKDLATLNITATVTNPAGESQSFEEVMNISGQLYRFADTMFFETKEIIGSVKFTATVTDVDGKTNSASITISVDQPAQPLTTTDFEWYRLGDEQSGLDKYGLYWEKNAKSPFAQIKPLDGVILYSFSADKWDATTTDLEKAALFSDGALVTPVYNQVDVNANATYNDVIGTKMADGTLHLIHVTKCVIDAQVSQGRPIHIYGQSK